ncbi:MAG: 16S rRNA processing protein RimM [Desulfobacteraceae bacterium]|nr:16S rRNA processing protein RimM [Desulfobacteraceae bacterium]
MNKDNLLIIGKVTGVHGLKGNLKVWSFAESIDTFGQAREIWLKSEGEEEGKRFTILCASARKKGVLISLEHVDNINLAEQLIGKNILIDKDQLPEIEENTWYWQDLYGLKVIDKVLGELGTIERIFPTNANDMLVVTNKETVKESEILIPMHEHFIESVDLDAKIIITTLPEGYQF